MRSVSPNHSSAAPSTRRSGGRRDLACNLFAFALAALCGCARPSAVQTTPADAVPRWIEATPAGSGARVVALYEELDAVGLHTVDAHEGWRSEFFELEEPADDLVTTGPEHFVTAHAASGKIRSARRGPDGWTHSVLAQVEPAPLRIELADLDLDGFDDLIVVSDGPRAVLRLYKGRSHPQDDPAAYAFEDAPLLLPLDPKGRTTPTLLVADLDGTHRPDLLLTATTGERTAPVPDHVRLLRGGGLLGLVDETMVRVPSPVHLDAGDLDEDGLPDVLAIGPKGAWLLHSVGHGWLDAPRPLARGAFSGGAIVDVHDDGHLDIVLADQGRSRIDVLRGVGGGRLSPVIHQDVGEDPVALAVVTNRTQTLLVTANASRSFTTVAFDHE